MQLFVGLGNPGTEYAKHRHNIGFMVADTIAAAHHFGPWKSKHKALVAEGRLGDDKIILLKPQTFMNESGVAVLAAAQFYKVALADIIVFYDELDLMQGKVRVKVGGGAAGHNGIRSIDAHIGNEYRRVRLGIGHPGHKDLVTNHVLGNFAKADKAWLVPLLEAVACEAAWLADGDDARFATAVAQKLQEKD